MIIIIVIMIIITIINIFTIIIIIIIIVIITIFLILQIDNLGDIFEWMGTVIVPNIYPTTMYNKRYLSKSDKTFVSNMYDLRLGPVFLRQIRVKAGK